MRMHVFSVYDDAAKAYLQPFFSRSKGEAIRSFTDACADEKSQFHKHLHDFTLVYLGEYEDTAGEFKPVMPEKVLAARELDLDVVLPFRKENRVM